jgi:tartrate dehydrogenase/decarboxylase/D-malate dehydrogenase
MPADGLSRLEPKDAIFLGAVGAPDVPDHVPVWDLILPIRQSFDQYVNLRPMRLLPGVISPLRNRDSSDIDMVCIRENSEGEYSGVGVRKHPGTEDELAEQISIFTKRGIQRIARFAFKLAMQRTGRLASTTKSNALQYSMVLWDEVMLEVAAEYPQVEVTSYHVDALAARLVSAPDSLDVIVASNLFGDILTDLGAAISGSLGIGPSGNINPEGKHPSMFEPIHGSAPDIAGKGTANPIGAVWAGALMLQHLGEDRAHDLVLRSLESYLVNGSDRTPDLGGTSTTAEVAEAIENQLSALTLPSDQQPESS